MYKNGVNRAAFYHNLGKYTNTLCMDGPQLLMNGLLGLSNLMYKNDVNRAAFYHNLGKYTNTLCMDTAPKERITVSE